MHSWTTRLKDYWALTKSLQTGLLLATGLAGYMSARCPVTHWYDFLGLGLSLYLAISGSTVLNMWYDRDLDAVMNRTHHRPLAAGRVTPAQALQLGLALTLLGIALAAAMSRVFGAVVFAGAFFDVVVYSVWLKRRTAWSVVWGGIAGAMPVLAGRTYGIGAVDGIGLLLALAVLAWIPTHIMTFTMRFHQDYQAAGIPTFPARYGFATTRLAVAASSLLAALTITAAGALIGMQGGFLRLLGVLSVGLVLLAGGTVMRPSEHLNLGLFKYASVYMLSAMTLLSL